MMHLTALSAASERASREERVTSIRFVSPAGATGRGVLLSCETDNGEPLWIAADHIGQTSTGRTADEATNRMGFGPFRGWVEETYRAAAIGGRGAS